MLTAFGLLIIAGLLFYRLVERRHKILLLKVLVGIAVLFAAVGAVIGIKSKVAEARKKSRNSSVRISLVIDPSRLADRAACRGSGLYSQFLREQQAKAATAPSGATPLYDKYLAEKAAQKKPAVFDPFAGLPTTKQVATPDDAAFQAWKACLLALPDTLTEATFRLCNYSSDTVDAVAFTPKTFKRGRSSSYPMVIGPDDGLASDDIIPPKRCAWREWTGRFVVMDSVEAATELVFIRGHE
jgi:hypothetical protein